MELNNNDAAAGAESIHVQPGLTSEIDLYAELVAFAKLSPEEQSRLGNHPVPASEPEGIVNSAPIETIEAESIPAETEETSAELVAKNNPPESVAIHLPEVQPESGMRDTADWTGSGEIVDAAKDLSTKEPVSTAEASSSPLDDRCSPAVTRPDPGGPLSALNLSQEIVFTGAMSRGVCLACGAESDADDLFCLTCGGFIDDVAPTPPSTPLCKVCKHRIDPDEIFCPWCGSSASA